MPDFATGGVTGSRALTSGASANVTQAGGGPDLPGNRWAVVSDAGARQGPDDQGYREAKAVMAFSQPMWQR